MRVIYIVLLVLLCSVAAARTVDVIETITVVIEDDRVGVGFNGSGQQFFDKNVTGTNSFQQTIQVDVPDQNVTLQLDEIKNTVEDSIEEQFNATLKDDLTDDLISEFTNISFTDRENVIKRLRATVESSCDSQGLQDRIIREMRENIKPDIQELNSLHTRLERARSDFQNCSFSLSGTFDDYMDEKSAASRYKWYIVALIVIILVLIYFHAGGRVRKAVAGSVAQTKAMEVTSGKPPA